MNEDARFEDGREAPLNLGAMDAEDLRVISSTSRDLAAEIAAGKITVAPLHPWRGGIGTVGLGRGPDCNG